MSCMASQPPSTDTNFDHVVRGLAERLERLHGPTSGGLVDGVQEVDVRVGLEQPLHGADAVHLVAVAGLRTSDARVRLVTDEVDVTDVDAEALQEALVALDADDRLALGTVDVDEADDGIFGSVAELGLGPLADEQAGLEVVRGEGDVPRRPPGSVLVSSAMTIRPASRAASMAGVTPALDGAMRMVVAPRETAFSMQAVCPSGSGSIFAPAGMQVGADLRGAGFRALDHPDPERVDVLLDDELDVDAGAVELLSGGHRLGRGHRLILGDSGRAQERACGQRYGR